MKKFLNRLLDYSWISMIVILLISVLAVYWMKSNTQMETDLDEYMPKEHPAFVYSDEAEDIFNIKDGIIIAIENKKGIYNAVTLQKIKDLTRAIQKLPEVEKKEVTSLYTADNIVGTELGLDVKAFYKKTPNDEAKLKELAGNVRNNEMAIGRMVSEDETVAIVIADIHDDVFSQDFYQRILDISHSFEDENHTLYVAGTPIVEGTLAYLAPKDMQKMVPIVVVVILLVLFLLLRSVKGTLLTFFVVIISTIWAFGLMAGLNIPIYSVSTMIPVMLIAIGVADGIHLFNHLQLYISQHPGRSKKEAIKEMIDHMTSPVVMTSITTAVGFVALLTSQVYPIKYFGLFTAFGVLSAMVLSLVFIPAGLMIFGLPKSSKKIKEAKASENNFAYRFATAMLKRKTVSIYASILIIILSVIGMQKIWINSSFLDKFEKDSEIVQTDAFINEKFGGTSVINLILESPEADKFKEPEALVLVDKLQKDVESNLGVVGDSFSLSDYLKRMNKVMHADKEAFNRIPDSKDLNAQYLLLYEMSGDPDNLWKVVNYDYSKLNLNIQLKSDDSKSIRSAIEVVEKYREQFSEMDIEVNYAGSGYKALVFTDLILEGQIYSLILSLFIVMILLSIMFRKIIVGLAATVPLILTALISFGLMGALDIPLSTTTALLSSIAIGIGIDYAVHFVSQYRLNARKGHDRLTTAKITMYHSGRAIAFNAIVVIAGFMVLLFSVFPPNRELGALISLNMFTTFVGTITILLVLLNYSKVFFKKKSK
ncbi:MAG TPA: efflux RND transporter permease subunit [Bacteroidales bacterium]|nr:efflux RND transporter permease subunit [Bacteroidales bacterium]